MMPYWALVLPWNIIFKTALHFSLDPYLVGCIAYVESRGEPCAIRYESHFKHFHRPVSYALQNKITRETEEKLQASSVGVLQIMGAVAREQGLDGSILELCKPEIGIHYGCKKLRALAMKYKSVYDIIASYNAGSPVIIKDPGAQPRYRNQEYVDKVAQCYRELNGELSDVAEFN